MIEALAESPPSVTDVSPAPALLLSEPVSPLPAILFSSVFPVESLFESSLSVLVSSVVPVTDSFALLVVLLPASLFSSVAPVVLDVFAVFSVFDASEDLLSLLFSLFSSSTSSTVDAPVLSPVEDNSPYFSL